MKKLNSGILQNYHGGQAGGDGIIYTITGACVLAGIGGIIVTIGSFGGFAAFAAIVTAGACTGWTAGALVYEMHSS